MSRTPISTRTARRWLAAALALAAGWLAAPALAGDRGPSAAQQTPAALYHNYCSVCHGDQGDGNSRAKGSLKPAPRDFTSAQSGQELTRERMIAAVTTGVPGTAMVGWRSQLSDDQIAKVVDYVRDTFMRPSIAADASRGRQIYARICSVCHGDRGAGSMWASANLNPAPRDFSSPAAKNELSRDRMLAAVAAGRPNTAMQAYGNRLSKDDMEAVVDYIRGAFMRIPEQEANISGTHARGAPAPERAPAAKPAAQEHAGHGPGAAAGKDAKAYMAAVMPHGLVGDAVAGKKFYDANCATCHGVKGDGQGPRAYFINPKPAVFTSDQGRGVYNRPLIFDAVSAGRRGTEMPAWDKVLTKQEIANVSEYVFRAFIQSGANKNVAKK
ncbi:c-type cytochrome [Ramlibacter alkalitolerans]|uniref:C-type cytochrome n=1 Tax=Ramlibacter alkalitolerans TaxID=2039631 RepID=A0ABS1JIZ1_9BURK|nr:cytochrome c [Ramlibacter alkalitolerans]MBL0424177.1 c-type cytochrome [Ramlibacter alkalitolerans]